MAATRKLNRAGARAGRHRAGRHQAGTAPGRKGRAAVARRGSSTWAAVQLQRNAAQRSAAQRWRHAGAASALPLRAAARRRRARYTRRAASRTGRRQRRAAAAVPRARACTATSTGQPGRAGACAALWGLSRAWEMEAAPRGCWPWLPVLPVHAMGASIDSGPQPLGQKPRASIRCTLDMASGRARAARLAGLARGRAGLGWLGGRGMKAIRRYVMAAASAPGRHVSDAVAGGTAMTSWGPSW